MLLRNLRKLLPVFAISSAALGCSGCSSSDDLVDGVFTADEFAKVQTLGPLPDKPQADTTSKFADDANAAALGHMLFFDKAFSGPIITGDDGMNGGNGKVGERGKIACESCHQPENWMMDRRSKPNNTSIGTQWMIRNAATAINSSFYKVWCEKDGIRDSQWSDSLTDPEDPTSMNGSRLLVAHVLYKKYKSEYEALFGALDKDLDPMSTNAMRFPAEGKPGDMAFDQMPDADKKIINRIYANFGKAVQAYVRTLVSRDAPIDKYIAGNTTALDSSQKNGLKLFVGKANCIGCHSGPLLSDSKFHNTGLEQKGDHVNPMETGRYDGVPVVLGCEYNCNSEYSDDTKTGRLDGLKQDDSQKGQWRTTQLRSVAETAPYMHTGQFATLLDVMKFYNDGGSASGFIGTKDKLAVKLNLTDSELNDLVNLMKAFTGAPLPADLVKDTSKP